MSEEREPFQHQRPALEFTEIATATLPEFDEPVLLLAWGDEATPPVVAWRESMGAGAWYWNDGVSDADRFESFTHWARLARPDLPPGPLVDAIGGE